MQSGRSLGMCWPTRPEHLEGELFSSWLIRMACEHGLSAEGLVTAVLGPRASLWNRDIDRSATSDQLERFSRASGEDREYLRSLTLQDVEGVLCESVAGNGAAEGVLQLGVYHRTRRGRGMMVCPLCLASDEQPFLRKLWRIAYVCACPVHRVELVDGCYRCGAEIAPHRNLFGRKGSSHAMLTCYACGSNIAAGAVSAKPEAATLAAIVSSTLMAGGTEIGGRWVHSLPFFRGLRCLYLIAASKTDGRERRVVERTPLGHRTPSAGLVAQWIADWPRALWAYIDQRNVPLTALYRSRRDLPFWIDREICARKRKQAPLRADEVAAITAAAPNLTVARQLSGRYIERRHLPAAMQVVSDQIYQALTASIERRGVGLKGAEADRIKQDRLWIELVRVRGLTLEQVCTMRIESLQRIAATQADDRLKALTTDYLVSLSSRGRAAHQPAFGRADRRETLTANGFTERFRKHVEAADLVREIPSIRLLRAPCQINMRG